MDKVRMESVNIIAENIDKIGALFPNCITETLGENGHPKKAINFELLHQMLSEDVVEGDEVYEFTWVGKKEAIVEANKSINKTLRPCPEESVDWDKTENLYIEGDNLEVLKLLQKSYLKAIKLIYIDPPYNTGHDFTYSDSFIAKHTEYANARGYFNGNEEMNFVQENRFHSGKYHSNWCSMIYSRLLLSRNLLKEDGVILINIDEHEVTNLKNICTEVFGEVNNLGTIVWDKKNPKGDAKGISSQHEYILAYAKNKVAFMRHCKIQRPKKNAVAMIKKAKQLFHKINISYTLEDANKEFLLWLSKQTDLSGGERAYHRIDQHGDLYQAVSMSWPNKKKAPADYFIPLIHPVTRKPCPVPERGWRNPSATMQELLKKDLIIFGQDEMVQPRRKYLLKDNMYENIPSILSFGGSDTEMLSQMNIPFDTPKVVSICAEHIACFTGKEDIILDYFSGSATIAHAVMQQNAKDGGQRKYIMVQVPEQIKETSMAYDTGYRKITDIGKDRIRRAAQKIKNETNANIDYGFRVLKCEETTIGTDHIGLDLLFTCLLKWGIPLSFPYNTEQIMNYIVYNYHNGDFMACFYENIPEHVIKEIAKKQPSRVVFCENSFKNNLTKIQVEEIFNFISPNTKINII